VIERLKLRPYEPILSLRALRLHIRSFLDEEDRAELMEQIGPLCLWDVSAIADFSEACAVADGFNSDLTPDPRLS
jgi:hypothetical protein